MAVNLDALIAQMQAVKFDDGKTGAEPNTYYVDGKQVKVVDFQALIADVEAAKSEDAKADTLQDNVSQKPDAVDAVTPKPEPGPTIPVIVGPVGQSKVFELTREFIQQHAPSSCILSEYDKNQERNLPFAMLEDEDPKIFKMWHEQITTPSTLTAPLSEPTRDIFALYVLAEKFGDIGTKNAIAYSLAVYFQRKQEVPTPEDMKVIWEGTPEWSPMRHLCVTAWTIFGQNGKWSVEEQKRFPEGFFAALAGSLLTLKELEYVGRDMDMRLVPNDFLEKEH